MLSQFLGYNLLDFVNFKLEELPQFLVLAFLKNQNYILAPVCHKKSTFSKLPFLKSKGISSLSMSKIEFHNNILKVAYASSPAIVM